MTMTVIVPRVEPVKREETLRKLLSAFLRLILPAFWLVVIYTLSFYLLETRVWFSFGASNPVAEPSWWMSWGHVTLGLAFFHVMLTNRALGPTMAFFQVVLAWALILVLLGVAGSLYGFTELRSELMPSGVMSAFLIGLILGHAASILTFDWQRGVPWWKAPLIAALVGPLVFAGVFYPFGYMGADVPWGDWMWMHFVVLAALGLLMIVPYALLRRRIRPASGLGGA